MRALPWIAAIVLAGAAAPATVRADGPWSRATGLRIAPVASGLDHPLFVAQPPGDPRLFVVEQSGRIRVIEGGRVRSEPFLDLSHAISYGGERGLLGLAFHPRYARNRLLYVDYTDRNGDTQVVRYRASADGARADPVSARRVISVAQPYPNHNGGMLAFGHDGMLYVGMGDGGSAGDPHGNGQNPRVLLGKLLRLDVDHGETYAIPRDNPYAGRAGGARPEIWATGLRNPWRFSFDRESDTLVIGDVGQNRWEEMDVVGARDAGLDYGWNAREGRHAFHAGPLLREPLVEPVIEYGHGDGCSVIGGYVYRGRALPELRGSIFLSDYCAGWLRSFRVRAGRAVDCREWAVGPLGSVTSFGEDADGELYVVSQDGRVGRIARAR